MNKKRYNIRWKLVFYDLIVFFIAAYLLFIFYDKIDKLEFFYHLLISGAVIFLCRLIFNIYKQIWRYGGVEVYIKLLCTDGIAFLLYFSIIKLLSNGGTITFSRMLAFSCINLLGTLSTRLLYRYAYKCSNNSTFKGKFLNVLLKVFAGFDSKEKVDVKKIRVAIVGAGRVGANLAEELINNSRSSYYPCCFIDINHKKVGRNINNIPVLLEDDSINDKLKEYGVQEVIFAIHTMDSKKKKELFDRYKEFGYNLKIYDYPIMQTAGSKRYLREIDIEELLFRKQVAVIDDKTREYYKDKTILITGGGGSIGSELCRQIASMSPKRLIILDIYENGAYDVQQELRILYGKSVNVNIEIASINNLSAMDRVFREYRPNIVINAAAHKHVPLMEHNVIEAIENNIFGAKIIVDLCEKYKTSRFMMVSTDKAVNPTNTMGATKRMCEMITLACGNSSNVKCSATRFGNVLGSAGSVIPLFKRQIASGGPVTITDKRIIRYFMTIKEASQLVLQSGAMANNGELFVLDMGEPVKIMDLAENMIKLSGAEGIDIIETGLRPGEKLYEELLVKTEELEKTSNDMIFIERDIPLSKSDIDSKLDILKKACLEGDNDKARDALKRVVPTFKSPEEVNKDAEERVLNKTNKNVSSIKTDKKKKVVTC